MRTPVESRVTLLPIQGPQSGLIRISIANGHLTRQTVYPHATRGLYDPYQPLHRKDADVLHLGKSGIIAGLVTRNRNRITKSRQASYTDRHLLRALGVRREPAGTALRNEFVERGIETHLVGWAAGPGRFYDAIHSAYFTARTVLQWDH
ncbi:MAG: hypothetical protein EOO27_33920 [Comamonadaceae bacterium]|nr:MAG: hypothetical protein EOO27_33920 [Comamonadaceae bacterium]